MPLVARAAAVYAVGLAIGLCTSMTTAMSAIALALLAGVILTRYRAAHGALAMIGAAGVLVALANVGQSARCALVLTRAREWTVTLETAATPGSMTRATL